MNTFKLINIIKFNFFLFFFFLNIHYSVGVIGEERKEKRQRTGLLDIQPWQPITYAQVEPHSRKHVYVNRLRQGVNLPRRATQGSAGFDIYTPDTIILLPGAPVKVETGLQLFVPPHTVGKLEGRSSLGVKGIQVLGGVIDSDYQGEISVILVNVSCVPVTIPAGHACAQLLLLQILSLPGVTECSGIGISRTGGFGTSNV